MIDGATIAEEDGETGGWSIAALFFTGIVAWLTTLGLMIAIPHATYVRWQAVQTEAFARLGWSYERIHFDPTPIDIALIGTSHTMNGIDGLAVAQRIAAAGVRAADGQCLTVTNLAIPSYGRNLHWLIMRELLSQRKPKAIVIEVLENETRKAHPEFSHVALTQDLVSAPRLFNLNYVGDLIRLPFRQVQLGLESLVPAEFGLKTGFEPARYDGSTVDNTRIVSVHGQAFTPPLRRVMDPVKLEEAAAALRTNKNLHLLPKGWAEYEYAVPNHYMRALLALADHAQVPVYLLYLPGYGQPPQPYDMSLYGKRKILMLNDILAHREYWHDVHHLNSQGAAPASQRVGQFLAQELAPVGTASAPAKGACQFGYPQAPITVPFRRSEQQRD